MNQAPGRQGRLSCAARFRRAIAAIACLLVPLAGLGQKNVERTPRVTSPDGKRAVAVEWDAPVGWGEHVEFQGRMLAHVEDQGGQPARQREIQAPQVRAVHPPTWLDNRWVAFTYNVQKNFNGLVYIDTADASALQVEMIAPLRRMGPSGRLEADLTSLDVTEHEATGTVHLRNITRGRASVFPLVLQPLQIYAGIPYPQAFLEELQGALSAYEQWLGKQSAEGLKLELGSESFAPDERHLALLGCALSEQDGQPTATAALVIVPVGASSAQEALGKAQLIRLDPLIHLGCETMGYSDSAEPAVDSMLDTLVRYTTRWQDARTVAVDREIADEEREQLQTEPVYLASLDGETTRLAALDNLPEPVLLPPDPEQPEEEDAAEESSEAKPGAKESSDSDKDAPKSGASSRRAQRDTPSRTPRPTRTPASARTTPAAERRIPQVTTPGANRPAAPATPTPYTAEPIPNLLERFSPFRDREPESGGEAQPANPPSGQSGGNNR